MTIDEYLKQLPDLKKADNRLYQMLIIKSERATRTTCSAFDGMPRTKNSGNTHETKLIEYIDAHREWKEVNEKFYEIKKQIEEAADYLLYWEGCLIIHVYIYNIMFSVDDPMHGVEDILHTKSQHVINKKLAEAKSHLRELLISRGVEIE